MKKIGILALGAMTILAVAIYLQVTDGERIIAQVTDAEREKRANWDKSITDAKFESVEREARTIQEQIESLIAKRYPKSRVSSKSFRHPANAGIGRKGQCGFDTAWVMKGNRRFNITLTFAFNEEDAVNMYRQSINHISMGEFYEPPEFVGREAVLVKNVLFNQKNTGVGLHFVKGRVKINTYIGYNNRSVEKNEKDLIEFVRLIEPLINAKPNINDL